MEISDHYYIDIDKSDCNKLGISCQNEYFYEHQTELNRTQPNFNRTQSYGNSIFWLDPTSPIHPTPEPDRTTD